jgi:hypothetical protein
MAVNLQVRDHWRSQQAFAGLAIPIASVRF